ncbi:MAG: hypothetical protein ACHREM_19890 [Polyangiales bacterium]
MSVHDSPLSRSLGAALLVQILGCSAPSNGASSEPSDTASTDTGLTSIDAIEASAETDPLDSGAVAMEATADTDPVDVGMVGSDATADVVVPSDAAADPDAMQDMNDAVVPDGGTCAVDAAATADSDCAICDGTAVDRSVDEHNCGACGIVCAGDAFCARGVCTGLTLANLCALPHALVINDGESDDLTAGAALATTLGACAPPVLVGTLSQTTATANGILDAVTHRPTLGRGDLLVLPGGSYGQQAVAYLDESAATPVYFRYDGASFTFALRSTDAAIVSVSTSTVTPHHDWFVAEMVVEPMSRTVSLIAYAFGGPGTVASAWWVGALANRPGSAGARWYLVEWSDLDGDSAPSAADAFTILASG